MSGQNGEREEATGLAARTSKRSRAESLTAVDVAGYNYLRRRYEPDAGLFPERMMVGSETYPIDIDRNWSLVEDLPLLLGDFTWTGWDYLARLASAGSGT